MWGKLAAVSIHRYKLMLALCVFWIKQKITVVRWEEKRPALEQRHQITSSQAKCSRAFKFFQVSSASPYSYYSAMLFVARHRLWSVDCGWALPVCWFVGPHCGRLGLCNAPLIASDESPKSFGGGGNGDDGNNCGIWSSVGLEVVR